MWVYLLEMFCFKNINKLYKSLFLVYNEPDKKLLRILKYQCAL